MSGPSRNPDKLNTIGIVVVGICGAVLVYVTIVALQAFYMNDTSEIQNTADYGGNETTVKAMKADQMHNIMEFGANPPTTGTYHIPIERAMEKVIETAKTGDALYVPTAGAAMCRTSDAIPGRGHPDPLPVVDGCPNAGKVLTPPPAPAAGSGAGSAVGDGSAAAAAGSAAGSAAEAPGGHAH